MNQLVLATGNPGKLREIRSILGPSQMDVLPQSDFSIPDAIEDGLSFVENAIIKARHASALTGLPAIADDSGLEVDALKGAPGIYSARYAGENASDEENLQKLLERMQTVPETERSARFKCVIVYMRHEFDPSPVICEGSWEGRIARHKQGENGFGYDPVFFITELGCCSAELSAQQKNTISHRGKALAALAETVREFQP